jgi:hypothetical protein
MAYRLDAANIAIGLGVNLHRRITGTVRLTNWEELSS